MDEHTLSFGPFEFSPTQRRLVRDGTVLRLGSRAFDVLATLVDRAGSVVSKEEIIAAVWPNTFVDEANLRVHISSLRKALGEDQLPAPLIENVPGRGYAFVAPVARPVRPVQEVPISLEAGRSNLPLSVVRPVGRDDFIATLIGQLQRRRLINIVGPGGMGKTTVAVAAAETVVSAYPDGVAFLDLGTMDSAELIVPGLLSVIERVNGSVGPVRDLWTYLQNRKMLLVLDNCEHLIEPVASLAEQLLRACPAVQVLATSREPLRVPSEWVQRLPPLDLPPENAELTAEAALRYPAIQLFAERASEALGGFELRDGDAVHATEICRRLDGIALAIELAAGRIDTIGLAGLANALDDRFKLLKQGRRTALPRHQTLRATLDWSFGLLSTEEQQVLRRLAVFNGGFTLEAARHVAGEGGEIEVDDVIVSLVAKSLLTADVANSIVHYRLLETTRRYCSEKLAEAGEAPAKARQHAAYYLQLFERAAAEWESQPNEDWLPNYGRELGNLRAALIWAFGPSGSVDLGIALTVSAIPLWFQLSLVEERLAAAKRAVAALGSQSQAEKRQRMQLNVVLGWPQLNAISGVESGPAAWRTVLTIAEELGETDYQLRALWALWVDRTNSGDNRAALALAERFIATSENSSDASDVLIGKRMRGRSRHLLGYQAEAAADLTDMLRHYGQAPNRSHLVRFQYDQRVMARSTLARTLLVRGFPERALAEIAGMVEETLALNDTPTLCHVLLDGACMVSLLVGDYEGAERHIALLAQRSAQAAMDVWHTYSHACAGALRLRSGEVEEGLAILQEALRKLQSAGFRLHFAALRGMLAEGLARSGRVAEAREAIDASLIECAETGENWFLPELQRIKGDIMLLLGDTASGEQQLLLARATAQEQAALAWELRSTTSLARFWRNDGREDAAKAALADLLPRIPEGFLRPDFLRAAAIAEALA